MAPVRGLIARCDDRGLGNQTWAVYRHAAITHTLVVRELGSERAGFPAHLDRYPGSQVVVHDQGQFAPGDLPTLETFIAACDVIYTAETTYHPVVADLAQLHGTRVVVHVNPELYRPDLVDHPAVRLWLPTPWLADRHPTAKVVPLPTEYVAPAAGTGDLPTFVHVAGKRAMGDRNGTMQLAAAVRLIRQPMRLRVTTQDGQLPSFGRAPAHVQVEVVQAVADRWQLYDGCDALVMPRRYGGLCLPIQEAAARGLAVLAPASPPHDWYPTVPMTGSWDHEAGGYPRNMRALGVRPYNLAARTIAATMDRLAADQGALQAAKADAISWAAAHQWGTGAFDRALAAEAL